MYQKIILVGNVGRVGELRQTSGGKSVYNLTVAVNKGQDQPPIWHAVTLWERTAEMVAGFDIQVGDTVFVEGMAEVEAYMSQDGRAMASLKVNAQVFRTLGRRGERETINDSGVKSEDIPF